MTDAYTRMTLAELRSFTNWLGPRKGYIGEVGIPSNVGREQFYPDEEQYRILGRAWYTAADAAGLMVTQQNASEHFYKLPSGGYRQSVYLASGDGVHKVVDGIGYQAHLLENHIGVATAKSALGVSFDGANLYAEGAGAGTMGGVEGTDFSSANPGEHDVDYWYPTLGSNPLDPVTGMNSFEYLATRGLTHIRLPFRWERLQPTLGGDFCREELALLDGCIANAAYAGLKVILDVHNFGGYFTTSQEGQQIYNPVGSAGCQRWHFRNLWQRLSSLYGDDARVAAYDLMNEPYGGSVVGGATAWEDITRSVVGAIRDTGDNTTIMVSTYGPVPLVKSRHPNGPWLDPSAAGWHRYTAHHYFGNGPLYAMSYNDEVRDAEAAGW